MTAIGFGAHGKWRWLFLMLAACAILVGAHWRFAASGAEFFHPDEVIAETLLREVFSEGRWDLSWDRPAMPPAFRMRQYNFSAYFYFVILVEHGVRPWLGDAEFEVGRVGRLRFYSAVLGVGVLGLAIGLGTAIAGVAGGAATGWLAAVNPLLVQDGYYARPDTFCTLLVLIGTALLLVEVTRGKTGTARQGGLDWSRLAGSGLALGLAAACKVSLVPLALLPLSVAWSGGDQGMGMRIRALGIAGGAWLAGLALGAPALLYDGDGFIAGVQALRAQYAGNLPPHSIPGADTSVGLAWRYFYAILGPGVVILVGTGWYAVRERVGRLAPWLLAAPVGCALAVFLPEPLFFERNYSHAMPLVLVLAGAGMTGRVGRLPRAALIMTLLVSVAFALMTVRGLISSVSGRETAGWLAARRQAMSSAPGARFLHGYLATPTQVECAVKAAGERRAGLVIEVWDCRDAWTQMGIDALEKSARIEELFRLEGPFGHMPTCTLHTYHQPVLRYFKVEVIER